MAIKLRTHCDLIDVEEHLKAELNEISLQFDGVQFRLVLNVADHDDVLALRLLLLLLLPPDKGVRPISRCDEGVRLVTSKFGPIIL